MWQETEYLSRSPANAKDLLQAVEDIAQRSHPNQTGLKRDN
ncbi:MAG: hypothetical protein QX203_19905 [Methylococcaceae bacterium]